MRKYFYSYNYNYGNEFVSVIGELKSTDILFAKLPVNIFKNFAALDMYDYNY